MLLALALVVPTTVSTPAPSTCPTAAPTTRVLAGRIRIQDSTASGVLDTAYLRSITQTTAEIWISGNCAVATMTGVFPDLVAIGGEVQICDNNAVASMTGAFANLEQIGGDFTISSNGALVSLGDASFPNLARIGTTIGSPLGISLSIGDHANLT